MDQQRAVEAAQDSVDQERLLEGEAPGSTYPEDAIHWTRVYSELLSVKRELLRVVEDRIESMQPEARREVVRTDLVVLDAEMKRFARRHEYWARRCEELARSPVAAQGTSARREDGGDHPAQG